MKTILKSLFSLLVIIGFVYVFASTFAVFGSTRTICGTVTKTEQVLDQTRLQQTSTTPESSGVVLKYRVFVKPETFETWLNDVLDVTDDNLIYYRGTPDASTVYGRLDPHRTYRLQIYGIRFSFLSLNPHIVGVQEVASCD